MNIDTVSSPALSLEHFEDFIKRNPDATSIVVSAGRLIEREPAEAQDQVQTKEAFKQALQEKYPDQVDLVDEAWDELEDSEKSLSAHTIEQVIAQAKENDAIWKEVSDVDHEEASQEEIAQIAAALNNYAEQVVAGLSPQEREALKQQIETAGLAVGGAGLVGLAANISTPAANTALANLLSSIAASLPASALNLPISGHLTAAVAMMGSTAAATTASVGTTAAINTAAMQVTIASAAPAIATFIVGGAIAHRLYVAGVRVSTTAHRIEHEINNISTAMLAVTLATIPPAQQSLLLGTIVGAIIGQHIVDPGIVQQAIHNARDAALVVYLFHNPEIAACIGEQLKSLLLSAGKAMWSVGGPVVATPVTTTTATTTAAATTTVATPAATTLAAHVAPAGLLPHSITAMATHGVSTATTVFATTIAAHPAVVASIILGGACMAAYQYVSSSSNSPQNQTT